MMQNYQQLPNYWSGLTRKKLIKYAGLLHDGQIPELYDKYLQQLEDDTNAMIKEFEVDNNLIMFEQGRAITGIKLSHINKNVRLEFCF